jgi:transcriptional regulator with GAF, ATPase, and Fis domain
MMYDLGQESTWNAALGARKRLFTMGYPGSTKWTARPALALVLRYGLAVSSVAGALGTALIQRHYNSLPRFISHYTLVAIAITFWYAGTGPGLLALFLSCLGTSLLARNHFLAPDFPLESFVILYAIFSLLVGWFSAVRRRAERLLTEARDNLEFRVAERTGELTNANEQLENTQAELRRREAYLAEAQGLSHTGSFGWSVISQEISWSEETYNIFEQDRAVKPTLELLLQRVHPDDRDLVQQTMARASVTEASFDLGHRLLMPDGSVKHLNVSARSLTNSSGELEFVGAVTDVTAATQARTELERAFEEIEGLKDRLQNENVALREEIDKASMFEEIVGTSPPLQAVLSRISKVAPTDSSVLITGETGTGKELVARAIHRCSRRSSHAFVSVNCAAIPRDLIASELFGHEKGAFTGATQRRLGRFELAEGGTIFLDEIGELPSETQIALLRVLQEHEFERVGGTGSIQTNVRVIAATNRDLEAAIGASVFRSDLFYRLNVFPIEIPPLRQRKEDIPLLVEYFIDRFSREAGKSFQAVSKKSLDLLQSYPWPGNIRELQNVIERSVIVCETEIFSVDESWLSRQPLATEPTKELGFFKKIPSQEKAIIEAALNECGGRVSGPFGAASKLGIPRSTLESKIKSLKIDKDRFKTADASKYS